MTISYSIETFGLRKEYGSKVAVKSLSLGVHQGEIFGFLGPNGAGKTTSIKMLLGLAKPTAGSANLFGTPLGAPELRTRIGFLPEHFRFPNWLTGEEFLRYSGTLSKIPKRNLQKNISYWLERVGLADFHHAQLRTYSKGMLQRIGLAQALIHDPKLVFLDEPTSGLDPVGRRMVRDIMTELREEGRTVFLNSHLLSEVEITCDRVAFIKHGEVLRIDEMKHLNQNTTRVHLQAQGCSAEVLAALEARCEILTAQDSHFVLSLTNLEQLPEINRFLVNNGVRVYALTPEKTSLEDLFLDIVGTDGGL
jgi:ABC-2 type transport system ATP-binding protein